MKSSKFTAVISNGDQYIIYNTLHNKALICSPEVIDLLKKHNDFVSLKDIHPSLFQRLYDDKFIVPNETDEFKEMINDIIDIDDSDGHYSITINPTLDCNLRCWYCYEEHLAGSHMSKETLNSIKKLLVHIANNEKTKSVHLSFFGGEPLIGFRKCVKPLIEFAISLCEKFNKSLSLSFTTNAILLNQEILDFLSATKLDILMQIPFDGGRNIHNSIKKMHNGNGTYDITLNNLKNAISKGISVIVRCNYTTESAPSFVNLINDIAPLYEKYDKYKIRFSFQKVWQDEENEETERLIKSFESRVSELGGSYYKVSIDNDRCYADKRNSFVINYNGDIYQCTAREFNEINKEGRLLEDGTIEHNERYYKRMESRFSNPECMNCIVYPICRICTTKRMEFDNTKCLLANPEVGKIDMLRTRISEIYKYVSEHKSQC